MSWNREGTDVAADYLGTRVVGRVIESRVKYGGRVGHTIVLYEATRVGPNGRLAEVLLVEESEVLESA